MISQRLQAQFSLIEMAAFPEWKKSSPERREQIIKELGKMEAKMIMKEIEEEVKIRMII